MTPSIFQDFLTISPTTFHPLVRFRKIFPQIPCVQISREIFKIRVLAVNAFNYQKYIQKHFLRYLYKTSNFLL